MTDLYPVKSNVSVFGTFLAVFFLEMVMLVVSLLFLMVSTSSIVNTLGVLLVGLSLGWCSFHGGMVTWFFLVLMILWVGGMLSVSLYLSTNVGLDSFSMRGWSYTAIISLALVVVMLGSGWSLKQASALMPWALSVTTSKAIGLTFWISLASPDSTYLALLIISLMLYATYILTTFMSGSMRKL